jgi:hypothetical protein
MGIMTPEAQRKSRRRKVARAIANLVQMADVDSVDDIKDITDLPEEDRKDAVAIADNLISLWDGLAEGPPTQYVSPDSAARR